jgi:hypothetical protein
MLQSDKDIELISATRLGFVFILHSRFAPLGATIPPDST